MGAWYHEYNFAMVLVMRIQTIVALLTIGMLPTVASAHGMDADWKQVGEKIVVEAFFDTGGPVRQARVQITDGDKKVVASAVTDADGKCTLRAPNPGKFTLVVDAGAGHRKEVSITIAGALPVPEVEPEPRAESAPVQSRREEAARFPWERVALGCGVVALLGGAWWLTRRGSHRVV